ncbi:MAG: hypothetical protein O3B84_07240 [Chloroflexi bacterium]|nr:hypothetical protein [Chloroflexota bacterium]
MTPVFASTDSGQLKLPAGGPFRGEEPEILPVSVARARARTRRATPQMVDARLERSVAQLELRRDALKTEIADLTTRRRQVARVRRLLDGLHREIAGATVARDQTLEIVFSLHAEEDDLGWGVARFVDGKRILERDISGIRQNLAVVQSALTAVWDQLQAECQRQAAVTTWSETLIARQRY